MLCPTCGYDLHESVTDIGTEGVPRKGAICPECGEASDFWQLHEAAARRDRPWWDHVLEWTPPPMMAILPGVTIGIAHLLVRHWTGTRLLNQMWVFLVFVAATGIYAVTMQRVARDRYDLSARNAFYVWLAVVVANIVISFAFRGR